MESHDVNPAVHVLMNDEQLWKALVRRSRGELTSAELAQLERWAAADPERSALIQNVGWIVTISEQAPIPKRAPAAWVRLRTQMREQERTKRLRLVIPQEPKRPRWASMLVGLGVAAGVAAVVAGSTMFTRSTPTPTVAMRELVTQRGERATLKLADGSSVVLGPGSRLRYPTAFGTHDRNVYLDGEGFFTVVHDTRHPFTVYSGPSAAQAVGTAFSVQRYGSDTAVQVVVAEGRVALRSAAVPEGTGTLVERGERGVLSAGGLVRIEQNVDVTRVTAWKDGQLIYQLTPLSSVVEDLERWFDLDIAVPDSALQHVRVTVTIEHTSADDALQRLTNVLGVRYVREGKRVQLIG